MGRCRGSISLKGFDRKSNVAQDLDQLSPLNIGRDYVFFLGNKSFQKKLYEKTISHKIFVCQKVHI